jgi:hypothetical protein
VPVGTSRRSWSPRCTRPRSSGPKIATPNSRLSWTT